MNAAAFNLTLVFTLSVIQSGFLCIEMQCFAFCTYCCSASCRFLLTISHDSSAVLSFISRSHSIFWKCSLHVVILAMVISEMLFWFMIASYVAVKCECKSDMVTFSKGRTMSKGLYHPLLICEDKISGSWFLVFPEMSGIPNMFIQESLLCGDKKHCFRMYNTPCSCLILPIYSWVVKVTTNQYMGKGFESCSIYDHFVESCVVLQGTVRWSVVYGCCQFFHDYTIDTKLCFDWRFEGFLKNRT